MPLTQAKVLIWNDFGVVQTNLTGVSAPVGFVNTMTFQLVFVVITLSVVMGRPQLIGSYFLGGLGTDMVVPKFRPK